MLAWRARASPPRSRRSVWLTPARPPPPPPSGWPSTSGCGAPGGGLRARLGGGSRRQQGGSARRGVAASQESASSAHHPQPDLSHCPRAASRSGPFGPCLGRQACQVLRVCSRPCLFTRSCSSFCCDAKHPPGGLTPMGVADGCGHHSSLLRIGGEGPYTRGRTRRGSFGPGLPRLVEWFKRAQSFA